MNFYFCEGCGKRLTENDLASGDALNKKVRGVYCADCGSGVNTIQFEAIRQNLSPDQSVDLNHTRKSQVTKPPKRNAISTDGSVESGTRTFAVYVVIASLCGVLIVVSLALRKSPVSRPLTVGTQSTERNQVVTNAPPVNDVPATPPTAPSTPEPTKIEETYEPEKSTEPGAPPVVVANTLAPQTATSPIVETPLTAPTVEPPVRQMVQALMNGSVDSARQTLGRMEGVSVEIANALSSGLTRLAKQDDDVLKSLRTSIGKNIKLETKTNGLQGGNLVSIDNGKLKVERPFMINGQEKGSAVVVIDVNDLKFDPGNPILGHSNPEDSEQWYVRSLTLIRERQMDAALAAAKQAAGHAAQSMLITALSREIEIAREDEAKKFWGRIKESAGKAQSATQATAVLRELEAFGQTYGETGFAKASEFQMQDEALTGELKRIQMGTSPAMIRAFKGKLEFFDPRTCKFRLKYDFRDVQQLSDWSAPTPFVNGGSSIKIDKNGLAFTSATEASRYFKCPFVACSEISLTLMYKNLIGSRVNFWLHSGKPSKTPELVLAVGQGGCFLLTPAEVHNRGDINVGPATAKSLTAVPANGKLEIGCQGDRFYIMINDKLVLEHRTGKPNDYIGFSWGSGWNSGATISEALFSGRADPEALAKFVAEQKSEGQTKPAP